MNDSGDKRSCRNECANFCMTFCWISQSLPKEAVTCRWRAYRERTEWKLRLTLSYWMLCCLELTAHFICHFTGLIHKSVRSGQIILSGESISHIKE